MADPVAATDTRQITVASYNIHSCIGRDGRYDPARILDVMAEIDADLYGLQEVDARPRQRGAIDQFAYFAENTGLHSIAGPNIVEERAGYGNALLSRWPVADYRLIDLSVDGCEPRGAISAVVRCSGRAVRIVNTHLGTRFRERRQQLARLHDAVSDGSLPTIFLGDYNMWGREQRALGRLGAPSDRGAAPKTYHARFPLFALDRIWGNHGADLSTVSTHASPVAAKASDHLPLKAVLELARSTNGQALPCR